WSERKFFDAVDNQWPPVAKNHLALLTSSVSRKEVAMPQAIEVETQAEQKSLADLHGQAATRGTSGELAFDRGEHALDQCAATIDSLREGTPHFGAHPSDAPGFLASLGWDYALRPELLPNVG